MVVTANTRRPRTFSRLAQRDPLLSLMVLFGGALSLQLNSPIPIGLAVVFLVRALIPLVAPNSDGMFAQGFLGFTSDLAWPRGVQEDDDVRWQWARSTLRQARMEERETIRGTAGIEPRSSIRGATRYESVIGPVKPQIGRAQSDRKKTA
jgi:hypothetical protein